MWTEPIPELQILLAPNFFSNYVQPSVGNIRV